MYKIKVFNIFLGIIFFYQVSDANAQEQKFLSVPFVGTDATSYSTSQGRKHTSAQINAPLRNLDVAYLIDLSIGTPPQPFSLVIDTGSSATWVPASTCTSACGNPYQKYNKDNSKTYKRTDIPFGIKYGQGFADGVLATDTFTVNNVTVPNVFFAISNSNDGQLTQIRADGILGIGPDALSKYNNKKDQKEFPTLVSTMYNNKLLSNNLFSIYFQPLKGKVNILDASRINGEITFGGVDTSKVASDIAYAPISTHEQFKEYWAIDISSVSIGKEKYSFSRPLATLVDTGSTMVFLPGAVLDKLFGSIQGAGTDADGVVVVPCQSQQLTSIGFHVGNYELSFDPEDYIMPNQSTDGMCPTYFMESDGGLEMLLGYGFLQHYVSIYDQEKKRIGLAKRR